MSLGEDGVLRIVQSLHRGVTDPVAWSAALDLLSEAFGGASLLLGTTPDGLGSFALAGHRMAQDSVALINGTLANRVDNPIFRTVPRAPMFQPVIVSDRLSPAELTASAVYRQALKPSGIRYVMTTVVGVIERRFASVSLGRSERGRDFDVDDVRLAATLAPHIGTALDLRCQLDGADARRLDAAAALDALDHGVILASAEGRIRLANREAERILAAADGLLCTHGRLGAVRPDDTSRLQALVARAARAGAHGALPIRRNSAGLSYAVQIAPAVSGSSPRLTGAVVFARDNGGRGPIPVQRLMGLYGLTPAEAGIASRLSQGMSLREAARSLQVSENTAKTQLKKVFEKVGVVRQSQLVRRMSEDLAAARRSPIE